MTVFHGQHSFILHVHENNTTLTVILTCSLDILCIRNLRVSPERLHATLKNKHHDDGRSYKNKTTGFSLAMSSLWLLNPSCGRRLFAERIVEPSFHAKYKCIHEEKGGEGIGGVRLPVAVVLLVSQHRNVLQRESHSQSDQQHRQEKPYKCLNTKMKPLLEEAFPVRLVNWTNVIQTNHKKSDLVGWLFALISKGLFHYFLPLLPMVGHKSGLTLKTISSKLEVSSCL